MRFHYLLLLSISTFMFHSCDNSKRCSTEYGVYKQQWDYIVKMVETSSTTRSDYRIQTTSGEFLSFRPYQSIIGLAEPGDRIVKLENTNWCYLIHETGDTMTSRVYSPGCDSIVEILVEKEQ
jgi:hypothetical protein